MNDYITIQQNFVYFVHQMMQCYSRDSNDNEDSLHYKIMLFNNFFIQYSNMKTKRFFIYLSHKTVVKLQTQVRIEQITIQRVFCYKDSLVESTKFLNNCCKLLTQYNCLAFLRKQILFSILRCLTIISVCPNILSFISILFFNGNFLSHPLFAYLYTHISI